MMYETGGMYMDMAPTVELDIVGVMEEINQMKGKKGTEIFFNVPGLDQFTGRLIGDIGENPSQTHLVFVTGVSGSGKGLVKQAMMKAVETSDCLREHLEYLGYRPWILDMSYAHAAGIALSEGALGPNPTWGNFPNQCLKYISGIIKDGVEWVVNTKEDDVTPIVFIEVNATTDPEKLDLGTSLIPYFGRYEGARSHGVGIVAPREVLKRAVKFRSELEKTDPEFMVHNNSQVLLDNDMQIDKVVSSGVLRMSSGSPDSVRGAYEGTNQYVAKLAQEQGSQRGVSLSRLRRDDGFRQIQLRDYMMQLFESSGIDDYVVEVNPEIKGRMTQLIGAGGRFDFPYHMSSRPFPRPYSL
jgi:hypothetical protein